MDVTFIMLECNNSNTSYEKKPKFIKLNNYLYLFFQVCSVERPSSDVPKNLVIMPIHPIVVSTLSVFLEVKFGYYAHPSNCSLYFVCVFGGKIINIWLLCPSI